MEVRLRVYYFYSLDSIGSILNKKTLKSMYDFIVTRENPMQMKIKQPGEPKYIEE